MKFILDSRTIEKFLAKEVVKTTEAIKILDFSRQNLYKQLKEAK